MKRSFVFPSACCGLVVASLSLFTSTTGTRVSAFTPSLVSIGSTAVRTLQRQTLRSQNQPPSSPFAWGCDAAVRTSVLHARSPFSSLSSPGNATSESSHAVRSLSPQQQQAKDDRSITTDSAVYWSQENMDEQHHKEKLLEKNRNHMSNLAVTSDASLVQPGPSQRDINIARILLIAAAALYGTNFSLVKLLGETDLPVGVSGALRFGMAALATSPWLFAKAKPNDDGTLPTTGSDMSVEMAATMAGLEVGFWNSIGYMAQAVGLATTAASKSAFICSLAVVVVPLLDFLAGKLLLPRQTVGAFMALAGVAILELGGMSAADFTLTFGDAASLLQPICFGIAFWRMEAAMQRFPNEANRSTAAQLLMVFLVSLTFGLFTDPGAFNVAQLQAWLSDTNILASLFWTGCISTALTVYMETLALKTLSAAETTLIFSTEPLWGTAFAALIMGETLGWESAVGAVLILSGCVFSNLGIQGLRNLLPGSDKLDDSKTTDISGTTLSSSHVADDSAGSSTHHQAASFSPTSTEPTKKFWNPWTKEWTQVGAVATFGAALFGVWNELSVGTRVIAMQVEEMMDNFL
jgi:drug/metabolite transporter (DMT)-like permease